MEPASEVAIVTGGAQGIGRATALLLAERGCVVAVVDLQGDRALETAAEIRDRGGSAIAIEADVTDTQAVKTMVQTTTGEFGRIDILVNNAGGAKGGPVTDITDEMFAFAVDANLSSTFKCCREVVPVMVREHYGRIVNMSSVAAMIGGSFGFNSPYGAAKAGVAGFTRALALETASAGITVNAVAPGAVGTALIARRSEEQKATLRSRIPVGRFAEPEEIAELICFLSSRKAGYITGEIVNINGGFYVG